MKTLFINVAEAATYIGVNERDSNIGDLILNFVLALNYVLGGIALMSLLYAGYLFMISSGNPDKVSKAKKALIYALIGVFLIAASAIIVNFLKDEIRCIGEASCNLG